MLRVVLSLLLFSLCAGCIKSREPLMHVRDRVNYAIQDDELKKMRFRISTEVFARDLSRGASPDSVIILPEDTIGRVTDVGETWLRVSFEEGGRGAVFVTDPSRGDDGYWIGTRAEDGSGYVRLRGRQAKILHIGGQSYRLVHGSDAYLIVVKGDLNKIIESRRHLDGR